MSCVQLSEGGFQVVYPLGLWSRSCQSPTWIWPVNYLHLHLHVCDESSHTDDHTWLYSHMVLHGESNKGPASPRTTKTTAQSKPPTIQPSHT